MEDGDVPWRTAVRHLKATSPPANLLTALLRSGNAPVPCTVSTIRFFHVQVAQRALHGHWAPAGALLAPPYPTHPHLRAVLRASAVATEGAPPDAYAPVPAPRLDGQQYSPCECVHLSLVIRAPPPTADPIAMHVLCTVSTTGHIALPATTLQDVDQGCVDAAARRCAGDLDPRLADRITHTTATQNGHAKGPLPTWTVSALVLGPVEPPPTGGSWALIPVPWLVGAPTNWNLRTRASAVIDPALALLAAHLQPSHSPPPHRSHDLVAGTPACHRQLAVLPYRWTNEDSLELLVQQSDSSAPYDSLRIPRPDGEGRTTIRTAVSNLLTHTLGQGTTCPALDAMAYAATPGPTCCYPVVARTSSHTLRGIAVDLTAVPLMYPTSSDPDQIRFRWVTVRQATRSTGPSMHLRRWAMSILKQGRCPHSQHAASAPSLHPCLANPTTDEGLIPPSSSLPCNPAPLHQQGLPNPGHLCYMAAAVQCVAAAESDSDIHALTYTDLTSDTHPVTASVWRCVWAAMSPTPFTRRTHDTTPLLDLAACISRALPPSGDPTAPTCPYAFLAVLRTVVATEQQTRNPAGPRTPRLLLPATHWPTPTLHDAGLPTTATDFDIPTGSQHVIAQVRRVDKGGNKIMARTPPPNLISTPHGDFHLTAVMAHHGPSTDAGHVTAITARHGGWRRLNDAASIDAPTYQPNNAGPVQDGDEWGQSCVAVYSAAPPRDAPPTGEPHLPLSKRWKRQWAAMASTLPRISTYLPGWSSGLLNRIAAYSPAQATLVHLDACAARHHIPASALPGLDLVIWCLAHAAGRQTPSTFAHAPPTNPQPRPPRPE